MPFLRAGIRQSNKPIEPVIPPSPEVITGIKPVNNVPLPEDRQLTLFHEEPEATDSITESNKRNKTKLGREYEKYVGLLYEKEGYSVEYNGINKGNRDGGIDLICKKGSYTVLVQCKCYESGKVSLSDICYLYGASHRYMLRHPSELVRSSFWTTRHIPQTSEIFRATIELGILLYENAKRKG